MITVIGVGIIMHGDVVNGKFTNFRGMNVKIDLLELDHVRITYPDGRSEVILIDHEEVFFMEEVELYGSL